MTPFTLFRPQTVAEAAHVLATQPDARLLAGGTDLFPNLRRGIDAPAALVDLSSVQGLAAIEVDERAITLGAGLRLAQLENDAIVAAIFRAVTQAAAAIAAPGHRSAATLGGNLCLDTRCIFYNQSDWWRAANAFCLKKGGTVCHVAPQGERCHAAFSGDLAPALIVHDATIELASVRGTRTLPLAAFYRDDGAACLQRAPDEVLVRARLPRPPGNRVSGYRKSRVRASIDFPLAGVAIALDLRDGVLAHLRVALTGTNSHPLLLEGTDALLGQPVTDGTLAALGKLVQKQVSPMRTTVTASNHRRQVAAALAQRLLRELVAEAGAASAASSHPAGSAGSTNAS